MSIHLCRWLGATAMFIAAANSHAADFRDVIGSTPGLLVHYGFSEAAGPVLDSSAHQRHSLPGGDVERGVDSGYSPLETAARLTSGGHLRLPELGVHDAVSVECWIKLAEFPAEGIAALYASDGWQAGFLHLNLRSSGAVEFAVNGAGAYPTTVPETLTPGRWTHLASTYDSREGRVRIFRDGRLVHEASVSPAPPVNLAEAATGVWFNGGPSRPLSAEIDELAIYSTALTPAQVRTHYLAGKGVELTPVDFARQVRPLLESRCFECHGSEVQESYLRLDVRDGAYRGGDSGRAAVAPYNADGSELIRRVTQHGEERMPPENPPLSEAEVALLRNWIDQGAPWPDELAGRIEPETVTSDHWSFQSVTKPAPPASDDPFVATGNRIDGFIFARLAKKGLAPSPAADRRTLIRRLYLDLHGLPPTPEEVERFIADESPTAWESLVDRVLASPRYGERWASHWLDVIRYGDTHGFEVNTPRENAWPYRDYVVKSLNEDKPFNQFLREQVAGDQLGADAATGFLVAAPALLPGQVGKDLASMRQARADELHEAIVSVSAGVLGLTVGCARCHDHKFDPISQRDYYRLQAVFAGLHYGGRPLRNPEEARLGAAFDASQPASVFGGVFSAPDPTHRLYRGDPMQRREQVAPDAPAVLGSLGLESSTGEAARRMTLADWLADPQNPLTPRVIVNRLWQHHFGTGIVATPSDFGAMGARPTHPELLDWLASTFIEDGWSMKKLHRRILTSNTYRQSNRPNPEGLAADAGARLLWRFPPRRLAMEPIRDSVLHVSGALDLAIGGPGFSVFKPNDNYVRVYDPKETWGPAEWRRMIYVHRVRMEQDGVFGAFDCPDAGQPAPRRGRSTTAIQALNLFNSSFMTQQAELFAQRVEREAGGDVNAQVTRAFRLALGREPSPPELSDCRDVAEEFGLATVCRALYNSNEFLFLP
ncbi:MAG: DUF1553 domain-containing protein [Planctomycetes bacterium]|nr:DUF1553 domain-containing protein [Planctomycetota bacterium]